MSLLMSMSMSMNLVSIIVLVSVSVTFRGVNGLSMGYYLMSCPFVDPIVKNTVNRALQNDPTLAASLIRMHFHDCFVEGCDGSVLIDSTRDNRAEKDSPANESLRGYEVIDDIKEQLENQCPGVVSCADIVAMAARDAVFWAGGPFYDIPKGRKDGTRSRIEDTANLPSPFFNASQLINTFARRGFTAQQMVALSGAHTLGVARCVSFKDRLDGTDTLLSPNFGRTLSRTCSNGDNAIQTFDATADSFDNVYYNALSRGAGVLFSDQTLFASPRTRGIVNAYAMNQALFFLDFQQAIIKMGMLDVKEGRWGQVRRNCRRVN
ncbi:peroxidase 47 [Cucurbita moschata]|uniref:Peroxidase n=1 Tax=Cucurbita moschata TaxID=3662 RepID=A0A6J1EY88_CUCMO|nr:peroxidase 47 [Cucurbita moschata]